MMKTRWRRGLTILSLVFLIALLGPGSGGVGCGGVARDIADQITHEDCPPYLDAVIRIENQSSRSIFAVRWRFDCSAEFDIFNTFEDGYILFDPWLLPGESRDLPIRYVPTGAMSVTLVWSDQYMGWLRTCEFYGTWSSDDAPWPPPTFHVDDSSVVLHCDPSPYE